MNGVRHRVLTILIGEDGMVLSVSKEDNQVSSEVLNMGKVALTPESEAAFAVHGFDTTSMFVRDATAQVEHLIFRTPAGDPPAKKIGERRRR